MTGLFAYGFQTEEQKQQDAALERAARLAEMNRCPVCGAKLVQITCNCGYDTHCPSCGGWGYVIACPKQGEHKDGER